jgi:hypothetical protein
MRFGRTYPLANVRDLVDLRDCSRLEEETCGIPHLAKNERDVGHPLIGGWERLSPSLTK